MPPCRRRVALGTAVASLVLLVGAACGRGAAYRGAAGGQVAIWPTPVRGDQPALLALADPRAAAAPQLIACLTAPGATRSRCRTLHRRRTSRGVIARLRVHRPGVWRLEVRAAGRLPLPPGAFDARRTLPVAGGRVHLLATGDSEIQGIDDMLTADLPALRVTGEAHISTGISKPFMFDWVAHAAAQARTVRPDITVMYIGANDGFGLPSPSGRQVNCCGPDWVAAFARRTRSIMASYARAGAGRVYWFTLPAPRDPSAQPIFRAINQAYVDAAAAFPRTVHLIDIRPVFTPGGRYRDSMDYQGRPVTVREPDGYHLSLAGDQIATSILIAAMRSDGLL